MHGVMIKMWCLIFLSANQYVLTKLMNNQQLTMKYCLNTSRNRFIIIINIYFNWLLFLVVKLINWVLVNIRESKYCFNESFKMLKTVLILLLVSRI